MKLRKRKIHRLKKIKGKTKKMFRFFLTPQFLKQG